MNVQTMHFLGGTWIFTLSGNTLFIIFSFRKKSMESPSTYIDAGYPRFVARVCFRAIHVVGLDIKKMRIIFVARRGQPCSFRIEPMSINSSTALKGVVALFVRLFQREPPSK